MFPILEIVFCSPDSDENDGDGPPRVTFSPAELACIAGELDLVTWLRTFGETLLILVIEGEFLGPLAGDAIDEAKVLEGEWRRPGDPIVTEDEDRNIVWVEGEARMPGELTRLGRQCLTESEPDWESLLLLGEPGEDTITCRGLSGPGDAAAPDDAWPPATDGGPTRGESGR